MSTSQLQHSMSHHKVQTIHANGPEPQASAQHCTLRSQHSVAEHSLCTAHKRPHGSNTKVRGSIPQKQ
jgi:hypothetical protein